MTPDERKALRDEAEIDDGITMVPSAKLIALIDALDAAEAKVERARKALREISIQKRTDELVTAYDVEYADFEGGYDCCVDVARAALKETTDDI